MENNLTDLQSSIRDKIPLSLPLIFLEIIFLIIVIAIIINLTNKPKITPEIGANDLLAQIEGMTEELSQNIAGSIYNAVSFNSKDDQNFDISGIIVRKNSLIKKHFNNTTLHYTSFIVDIPKIEQSYRVYYDQYEDDGNGMSGSVPETIVACLSSSDKVIYKEFNCRDNYNNLVGYSIMRQYEDIANLNQAQNIGGYKVYLPGDKRYDGTTQDNPYVEILAYCEDGTETISALSAVSDYFKELGFNIADFNYGIFNDCEHYEDG